MPRIVLRGKGTARQFWMDRVRKKLGNPDGLPSFFRTPIIQNCRAVPLPRKTMRDISLRETGQFAQRPHWGLCRLRRPQDCEAPLERQFLMQRQENSRELPYGDVGLPASAGISLCEIAEPLVVVKLCGGEATNSPVDCSSAPCGFAALRQNAGHAFGPQARLTPHCAKIALPEAMLSCGNTPKGAGLVSFFRRLTLCAENPRPAS